MYVPVGSSDKLQGRLLCDGSALLCDSQFLLNSNCSECLQIQPGIGYDNQKRFFFSESDHCLFVHTWKTSTTCQPQQQMQADRLNKKETASDFSRGVQPLGRTSELVCSCAALCKQIHRGYACVLPRGYRYKVPARVEFHDPVEERTLLLGVDRDKETAYFVEQDSVSSACFDIFGSASPPLTALQQRFIM
jgi:hypothetical protein